MATREQLYEAGRRAHEAGNFDDARAIADLIHQMDASDGPAAGKLRADTPLQKAKSDTEFGVSAPSLDDALAFGAHAAEGVSLGAALPVTAFVRSTLPGETRGYAQIRDDMQAEKERMARESPVASTLGGVAGSVALGGLAGAGLRAAAPALASRALPYLMPGRGDGVGKAALKLAAGGALGGGATSLGETGVDMAEAALGGKDTVSKTPLEDAAVATGLGAGGGAVLGAAMHGVGSSVARGLGDELSSGWRYLAKKFNVDPGTLQTALHSYEMETGRKGSVAAITNMHQQGVLSDIAANSSSAGASFRAAAREGAEDMPAAARGLVERHVGVPSTVAEREIARDAPVKEFMDPVRDANVRVPISQTDLDLLSSRGVMRSLSDDMQLRVRGLHDADPAVRDLHIDDVDNMRRGLNATADRVEATQPDAARSLRATAQRLGQRADEAAPGYDAITLRGYGAANEAVAAAKAGRALDADYIGRPGADARAYGEGAARGVYDAARGTPQQARGALTKLSTADDLQEALHGAYAPGQVEGLQRGARALRRGQEALETIAPGRVTTERPLGSTASEAADVGAAVVGAVHGSKAGLLHRLTTMVPAGMSDTTAGKLADMLTSRNPRVVGQAIEALRRGGAAEEAIRDAQRRAAFVGGDRSDPRRDRKATPTRYRANGG